MAAGNERLNLQTGAARLHSLHRKVGRRVHDYLTAILTSGNFSIPCHT
jgi:hypothetical protein